MKHGLHLYGIQNTPLFTVNLILFSHRKIQLYRTDFDIISDARSRRLPAACYCTALVVVSIVLAIAGLTAGLVLCIVNCNSEGNTFACSNQDCKNILFIYHSYFENMMIC